MPTVVATGSQSHPNFRYMYDMITDLDDNVSSALAHAQDVVGANPDTAIECWINMEDDTEAQAEQLLELIDEDDCPRDANTSDGNACDEDKSSANALANACTDLVRVSGL